MASSPQLKIFNPDGDYIASCKYYEDAAMLVGSYGHGAKVKLGHSSIIWNEGQEEIEASESFDRARQIMVERVDEIYKRSFIRLHGQAAYDKLMAD